MYEAFGNDMYNMMEAFFNAEHLPQPSISNVEAKICIEASIPLYEGSQWSCLWACLSLLNLQENFGWPNNNMDALSRYAITLIF